MLEWRRPKPQQVDIEQLRQKIVADVSSVITEQIGHAIGEAYRLGMIAGTPRVNQAKVMRLRGCDD